MDPAAPNYHREFLKSPHHAVLGVLTLGLGFMSASVLGLIAGATAYLLGWIYLPDLPLFRRWVQRRHEAALRAADAQGVTQFLQRRDALLRALCPEYRERYGRLAQVCRDIEAATADNAFSSSEPGADPRLRKLDELMWTSLRLLSIQESLEQFLQTEARDNVPDLLREAEAEAKRLNAEVEALKAQANNALLETRQRYLGSRLERLEVLRKRQQRSEQARANRDLVVAEQDRLDQQIKLIRADAIASKNAESLTARIDATVEHLDQTNKWLSEMDEFKDLAGDLPPTQMRIGYQPTSPQPQPASPPIIIPPAAPRRESARQRQM
jgi:hypothetical protein